MNDSLAPQARAAAEFLRQREMESEGFDVYDDRLMKACIGGSLSKPVQALLITLSQWDTIPKEAIPAMLKMELLKLREAVKEEFNEL